MTDLWRGVILCLTTIALSTVDGKRFTSRMDDNYVDLYSKTVFSFRDRKWTERVNDQQNVTIGQVGGLSTTWRERGKLYVFHRGSRTWDEDSFDSKNVINPKYEPIPEDTILEIEVYTGDILAQYGSDMFYMPHGLTVDNEGYIWVTDVGRHQVIKLEKQNKDGSPEVHEVLTLGEKFVPGNDRKHFCKPTAIAILSDGDFFVADGYCNDRLIRFSADGQVQIVIDYLMHHESFAIPHSLALNENMFELCVADRENERIVCIDILGHPERRPINVSPIRPYAIAYDSFENVYHVVGEDMYHTAQGLTISLENEPVIDVWESDMPDKPHAIAASGDEIFVGGLDESPRLVKMDVHGWR